MNDDAPDEHTSTGSDRPAKPSRADKLAARAEQLRERDARREAERAARPTGAASRRGAWVIATSALTVATVVLATLLVIGYFSWHHQRSVNHDLSRTNRSLTATVKQSADQTQLERDRAQALAAAKAYAVAFGTYDYQHLSADFGKAAGLMTPAFAARYTKTSQALAKTFAAYKTKVTASVPDGGAAVISVSSANAQVLVLLDQVITSSTSKTPKINRNRLKVTLVHSGGKWLVDRTDAI